jgi:hypothetical protein
MIAPILVAAVAVSVATGAWSISTVNGHVHLRTTWSDATGDHSSSEDRDVDANKLGIAVPLASNGSHVRFGMHREAGGILPSKAGSQAAMEAAPTRLHRMQRSSTICASAVLPSMATTRWAGS